MYLLTLILGQWDEAAEQMATIYDHDAKLWEKSIFQFAKRGHLKVTPPQIK